MRTRDSLLEDLLADALSNPPFTQFVAEHRPLRPTLEQFGRLVAEKIALARTLDELDRVEATMPETLSSFRPDLPELGPGGSGGVIEGELWGERDDHGAKPALTRFWFRRQILGAVGLLNRWPTATSLAPVDRDSNHEFLALGEAVWSIQSADDDAASISYALYTPIDLTHDELELVHAGARSVQEIYDAREQLIVPIIAAIRAEAAEYFDTILPARAQEIVLSRRKQLTSFASVKSGITFPEDWKLEKPKVATTPAHSRSGETKPTEPLATPVFRDRLAEASFEDLQRAIRVWANAVERYPAAFSALEEERVSDLLAATLHASLPGADREVFSRRGKTDIQVRAKALDDGSSEARIFIAETKYATAKKVVREALDPQLFDYLNSADTAAVLLLLFRQKNRVKAYDTYLPLLKGVSGFVEEQASSVKGWKINRYVRDGKELRLLVATVHIPPTRPVGG